MMPESQRHDRGRPESSGHKAPPALALSLPARVLEWWSNWKPNEGRSETLLSELTLPALGLVVGGLIGFTLLLGLSEEQARDGYKVVFCLMVGAQMVLAVTVVRYKAGLPIITKRAA